MSFGRVTHSWGPLWKSVKHFEVDSEVNVLKILIAGEPQDSCLCAWGADPCLCFSGRPHTLNLQLGPNILRYTWTLFCIWWNMCIWRNMSPILHYLSHYVSRSVWGRVLRILSKQLRGSSSVALQFNLCKIFGIVGKRWSWNIRPSMLAWIFFNLQVPCYSSIICYHIWLLDGYLLKKMWTQHSRKFKIPVGGQGHLELYIEIDLKWSYRLDNISEAHFLSHKEELEAQVISSFYIRTARHNWSGYFYRACWRGIKHIVISFCI